MRDWVPENAPWLSSTASGARLPDRSRSKARGRSRLRHPPGQLRRPGKLRRALLAGLPRADKDLARRVNESLFVGTYRTPLQDLECSIGEVVELGVRALSPGINDPFTANTCIDRLSAALGRLAKRRWTSPLLKDDEGVVRVIALPFSFPRALDAAFNLFRQYGRTSTSVNVRLPEGLQHISTRVVRQEDRQAIMRQATMIRDGALTALPDEYDREDVEDRFRKIVRTLERPAPVIV